MKERISKDNYLDATFEDWIEILNNVYYIKNDKREVSDMWLRVVSDSSKVGEAVRKNQYYEAIKALTTTFGWIFTTVNKMFEKRKENKEYLLTFENEPFETLTEMVLSKYPGVCPVCRKDICHCSIKRKEVEEQSKETRLQKFEELRNKKLHLNMLDYSISDIEKTLDNIYGSGHYQVSLEMLTFHFLEEVGEVAWCLTNLEDESDPKENEESFEIQLPKELADVVSWGFAIYGKLYAKLEQANKMAHEILGLTFENDVNKNSILAYWLWNIYSDKNGKITCHLCNREICSCGENGNK